MLGVLLLYMLVGVQMGFGLNAGCFDVFGNVEVTTLVKRTEVEGQAEP